MAENSSNEKPILFSSPMVQALLREENPKTQTRRIVKPQPFHAIAGPCRLYHPTKVLRNGQEVPGKEIYGFADEETGYPCPYGGPGTKLWVREMFQPIWATEVPGDWKTGEGYKISIGLKKRGYWYRPDAKGYTDRESEAGRYTREDASRHEYSHGEYDERVVIVPFTPRDFYGSLDTCSIFEKTIINWRRYSDNLMRLVQDSDPALYGDAVGARYRTAVATAPQRCAAFLAML